MKTEAFFEKLVEHGLDFFAGVPDSLLKDFCAYVEDHARVNIITANEGNAVALAAGRYMASGKPAVVYMQNSGIGNAVNPLVSLIDDDVYAIPLLMIIGWRGEPGIPDEPQHLKQGKITLPLLDTLGIAYRVADENSDPGLVLNEAAEILGRNLPFAVVAKKGTFSPYKAAKKNADLSDLGKEEAIEIIVSALGRNDLIVSTTGKTSRELFEIREKRKESHSGDFLVVGSMGHASQIALGIALEKPEKRIYCLDGDGAFFMHMGSVAVNASVKAENLKHIVFNNGAHDSVGGQPTVGNSLSIKDIAVSCGIEKAARASTKEELADAVRQLLSGEADFLEVLVRKGSRPDLGRPTISPVRCKTNFMENM
ncbi:MAG: phosphonopyruvate decarboxylase [Spirochaetales bacterium]|nr:phosphonopyruvate decarboxylase [Spirochaetales bacterium]